MPRKLNTYQTSVGFYDLAVAAPSMKAALKAWGAGSNLFHQGIARETDDPDIVAATMRKPGVVLKRPAGSSGRFAEHSDLPSDLGLERADRGQGKSRPKPKHQATLKISEEAGRKAAAEFEREQRQREEERRREEAVMVKERERRERAVAKAQAALDDAREDHKAKARAIEADRASVEKRAQEEEARCNTQREKLEAALHLVIGMGEDDAGPIR
jgi:colicin import membrane protein